MITGRMKCARCRWIRRRESGYHVASASWLKRCGRSLSLGDLAGTVRVWLCWWVDVGGGWSLVGVAEYGAQRGEDVYFPGQMQGVVVGGSYPGDRSVWGGGGRQRQGAGDLVYARWPR
jgi:hypothetical protein